MRAPVNRIIPFSSVDGPGNRTAIFLQGCNLDCRYCHNPETRHLCISCGTCVALCPSGALTLSPEGKVLFEAAKCLKCDVCISNCPHGASPRISWLTPEETWELVKRQIPFIRGITASGGECLRWPEFLRELFGLAREAGLSTLIDTNGTIPLADYPELLQVTSGIMLDIKAQSDADHRCITGEGNEVVLANARFLGSLGKLEEVRSVVVPDLCDSRANTEALGEFLWPLYECHPFAVKLISYRPWGVRECYASMAVPDKGLMEELREMLLAQGFSSKHVMIV